MEIYQTIIFFLFLIVLSLRNIFIKKKLLLSYTGSKHQKFTTNKAVPTVGGILILIAILFGGLNLNILFFYFLFLIFFIGILSDLNFLKSPSARFFFQFVILFVFIFTINLHIPSLRISIIDLFLQNKIVNYFFLTICFMILLNGSNFIDGCNTLSLGFYLIILIILYRLGLIDNLFVDAISFYFFFLFLFFILVLNLFQKIFLGESGVYVIAFFTGYILVNLTIENQKISPYFIANLLWYPSFEVLYSIIRKAFGKKTPFQPDTSHLHHLVFFFLKKKFKIGFSIFLFSKIINFYNLVMMLYASKNISNTTFQSTIILCNIIIYCLIYKVLAKVKKKQISK